MRTCHRREGLLRQKSSKRIFFLGVCLSQGVSISSVSEVIYYNNHMKVSFIVPNFNGEEILHKNLPRVLEAAELYGEDIQHFTEVIVIDDCSTDRSVTVIESIFSKKMSKHVKCLLLKNSVNKGFSSTVNKGARQATGEILVLLNTDAYPE